MRKHKKCMEKKSVGNKRDNNIRKVLWSVITLRGATNRLVEFAEEEGSENSIALCVAFQRVTK